MGENAHQNFASYKWLVTPRKLKLKVAVGKSQKLNFKKRPIYDRQPPFPKMRIFKASGTFESKSKDGAKHIRRND